MDKLRVLALVLLVLFLSSLGSASKIESGSVKITSSDEGNTVTEDIGFRPDYIEFITAQQIDRQNFNETDPQNSDCPDNVNGWSEGSAIFSDSGVKKQFSIGMFRNSDSTNGHQVGASTSDVIKNIYSDQDGYQCGKLEVSVAGPTSNGFKLDVQSVYNYNEIIRYKAYEFPDNMGFDAGMVKIENTGPIEVNSLGFQPANLHIRAGQQITSKNMDKRYYRDPMGRSKGYATLDKNGNVIDQQSIGTASSSDSTNAHRSLASDKNVLNTVYTDQDGNVLGRLNGTITGADSDGFTIDITEQSYGSDEIFLYRAWGFSYYKYQVGYEAISSDYTNWNGGEPNDSGGEDCAEMYNGGTWNDASCGDNHKGVCEYDDGTYDTTSTTSWSNARSTCRSRGGDLVVVDSGSENSYIDNNYGNVWIGYYQLDSGSEPGGKWRTTDKKKTFRTGFEPNAIDIYAEQQIKSINNEVLTPKNDGCSNAGGWSNGYYERDDDRQWAITNGRTSASQNTHWYGSTTSKAMRNLYWGGRNKRGKCGWLKGEVTSTSSSGFTMDFSYNSKFKNNYGEEMVYYRAFKFLSAPPNVTSIEFFNSTNEHSFRLVANITEGSDDINSCTVEAEHDGNSVTYDNSSTTLNFINKSFTQCKYRWVNYSDNSGWVSDHSSTESLLNMDVTVEVSDTEGKTDQKTESNTFPNHDLSANGFNFTNYTTEHAFNVSANATDPDDKEAEWDRCKFNFSDDDGNWVEKQGDLLTGRMSEDDTVCFYSNVNDTMPRNSTGDPIEPGFETLENIDVNATFYEIHGEQDSVQGSNVIPNLPPEKFGSEEPLNDSIHSKATVILNFSATDPDDDKLKGYFFNKTHFLGSEEVTGDTVTFSSNVWGDLRLGEDHKWYVKVSDGVQNSTFPSSGWYQFLRSPSSDYQAKTTSEVEYSSLVLTSDAQRAFFITVNNRIDETKDLRTYLTGVNATFPVFGSNVTPVYTLEPYSEREFLVRVDPTGKGKKTLNITTENVNIMLNSTASIPVLVRDRTPGAEPSEVPGIGALQLLILGLSSAFLYFSLL